MSTGLSHALAIPKRTRERRACKRYAVQLEVRYKQAGIDGLGVGATVNLSGSGLLFTAETPIAVGHNVEVAILWPARLDDTCGLQLVAKGAVVRCEGRLVALQIQKYEFRTRRLPTCSASDSAAHNGGVGPLAPESRPRPNEPAVRRPLRNTQRMPEGRSSGRS